MLAESGLTWTIAREPVAHETALRIVAGRAGQTAGPTRWRCWRRSSRNW